MKIKKLSFKRISEPENAWRTFEFASNFNYFYSQKNSTGKSTLMRLLLYALGFNIPNTRKVKFEEFLINTEIDRMGTSIYIKRIANTLYINDIKLKLPNDTIIVHSLLFNSESVDLLENILGVLYIDQDRGWTLLNRGTIIGGIKFYIEVFLHGLKGADCDVEVKASLKKIEADLEKYRQMKVVAEYKEQAINATGEMQFQKGEITFDTQLNDLENERRELILQKQEVEKHIKFLEKTINDDKKFVDWLESHNIIVQGNNGEMIPVTRNTILNYVDNNELNKIEIRREYIALRKILNTIAILDEDIRSQTLLFKGETIFDEYERRLIDIPINLKAVNNTIKYLIREQSNYREILKNSAWRQNVWAKRLNGLIQAYAKELKVDEYLDGGDSFLFKDIKSISGAIYHKLVFVFRICYNQVTSEMLGYNLPMFIDSPNGREVEKETISTMFSILERDFSDRQIFIASIFNFIKKDTTNLIIEMNGTLFDFVTNQMSLFDLPLTSKDE